MPLVTDGVSNVARRLDERGWMTPYPARSRILWREVNHVTATFVRASATGSLTA